MKDQKIFRYIISCVIGVVLITTGIILAVFYTGQQGNMQALPFVLAGVGFGIFGGGLSFVLSARIMKKDPKIAKQIQVEENDERNITIEHKARAKTDAFVSMLLWALIIFLAVMQVHLSVILVFLGAAFLRMFVLFYWINKYHKEM